MSHTHTHKLFSFLYLGSSIAEDSNAADAVALQRPTQFPPGHGKDNGNVFLTAVGENRLNMLINTTCVYEREREIGRKREGKRER